MAGWTESVGTVAEEEAKAAKRERTLQNSECRRYLERTLRREFRAIVRGFVSEARNGSCAHMKLATELLESAQKSGSNKKGTAQRLLEELGE